MSTDGDSKPRDPCDLMALSNMGIAVAYFTVGCTMSFITNPLNIYLVNTLNAEPDLQGTINILMTLPWSLKIIVGFMSDAVPLFGMHRKPYLVAGVVIYTVSWLYYAEVERAGAGSLWMLSIVVFISTMGLIIIDVMADTMTVERSKYEPDSIKGQMQATCYSARFGGAVLGAFLGTIFSQRDWSIYMNFTQICRLNGYLGGLVLPFCVHLKEKYRKSEVDPSLLAKVGLATAGATAYAPITDVSLNKAAAPGSYQYGYVPVQRRISTGNEMEMIEKGQMQAYLTTPIKPIKRYSAGVAGGFSQSAQVGEYGYDPNTSQKGGEGKQSVLSPFSKTPKASQKSSYSRGPGPGPLSVNRPGRIQSKSRASGLVRSPLRGGSRDRDGSSGGSGAADGDDELGPQEDTPLIRGSATASVSTYTTDETSEVSPRSARSGEEGLVIATNTPEEGGRERKVTNLLSPSFHFGASPLVYSLDPAANQAMSESVPSPHIHVLTDSDLDMTLGSLNTSNNDYTNLFSPSAMVHPDDEMPVGGGGAAADVVGGSDEEETVPVQQQIQDIWATVQLQAVWRPMAFVYLFNLLQVPNVAWQSYLQLTLHFEPWVLGLSVLFGSVMTFVGILIYKYYLFNVTWVNIYVWSAFLTTFFSLMQLLLIFQINRSVFHMGNYFFSLGDDVITAYISGIQFLPVCIMYMRLCPEGAEGASYAILTTFGNIALVCANSLGNVMSKVWDVSNNALREGDVDGLWRLSLLTSIIPIIPLFLIFLLPQTREEQVALGASPVRSKLGGICFLAVLAVSLAYCIGHSLSELMQSYTSAGVSASGGHIDAPMAGGHGHHNYHTHHHFA